MTLLVRAPTSAISAHGHVEIALSIFPPTLPDVLHALFNQPIKIRMAFNGPVPTALVALTDLHKLKVGDKVRFLGW